MDGRIKKINTTKIIPDAAKKFPVVIFCVLALSAGAFAAKNLEIRELAPDILDINEANQARDSIYKSKDIKKAREESEVLDAPVLKGGVSELKAIVGKSRIFRFDEPLKRFSITNPDLVEMVFLSPREILINGTNAGETTVIIWGQEGEPLFFNLFVEQDNINFVKEVKRLTNKEDINIDFVNGGSEEGLKVMLTGKLSSSILKSKIDKLAEAYGYSIVDLTETLIPQVLLEVKIVEINKERKKSREYDIKEGLMEYLDVPATVTGKTFTALNDLGEAVDDPWVVDPVLEVQKWVNNIRGNTFTKDGFQTWATLPFKDLSFSLEFAESEGLVKIIAEPSVMVVHGEEATFNSGEEIPVPDGVDELGTIQYTYRPIGINVAITPEILEETERVILTISTEISELSSTSGAGDNPTFATKKGTTKVEVKNNHTTVITGLVKKTETNTTVKFPFLSSLPVIGTVFDRVSYEDKDSEIMIFVTPSIVKADLARED